MAARWRSCLAGARHHRLRRCSWRRRCKRGDRGPGGHEESEEGGEEREARGRRRSTVAVLSNGARGSCGWPVPHPCAGQGTPWESYSEREPSALPDNLFRPSLPSHFLVALRSITN